MPGFPLDGGRVLRAILWWATGSLRRATQWASGIGQAFAWVLIAAGFLMMLGVRVPIFGTGLIGGIWLAFIGWFLHGVALMSYRQLLTRESLEGVPVSRVMQTRFERVGPDMSVQELVEEHMLRSGQRAFPVIADERLAGIVCLEDIKKVEQQRRASTPIAHIMTPAERLASVGPNSDAHDALALLAQRNLNQLPVVHEGRILGLVTREDIVRWLALARSRARGHRTSAAADVLSMLGR